ncbi:MAG TPA: OmpA family protein, partial [Elusimicrobiales bacterium]|nr:OmpA family protein [Elusimicrobiales bacterium]
TEPPVMFAVRALDAEMDELFPVDESELSGMLSWQVQILDARGRKVGFMQGKGGPSPMLSWSGLSRNGEPLPSGFYRARLIWMGEDEKVRATENISFNLFTPLEISDLAEKNLKFRYTPEGLVLNMQEKMIFRTGGSRILEGALPALNGISRFLKTYYRNGVVIRGFTDSTGSPGRNLSLSYERALRVYSYLVASGIDPRRLAYEGLGPARPIAPNATEEGRARNRRVEVVVLKKKG